MKKLLSVLLLSLSVIFLVACGSKQSLDGVYYSFDYVKEEVKIYPDFKVEFKGDVFVYNESEEFLFDKDKKAIMSGNGQVKSYEFDPEKAVLTYDDDTYVKVGSPYYDELIKNGAVIDEQRKTVRQVSSRFNICPYFLVERAGDN